ncbi:hypothetical protein HGI30_06820 [Paenibacillus albicereus]|uniref:Uncharacterized protein n=1 Tax=Paenibacillus albicereus TaxID=2726185 RepID=A0A6H2GV54_9BACL|nr:hypothetical protein [Paenibacillus albicereus]QJC51287.1 hypothetical protein HGI30_06820 [Paenibacillus albicereus]
MNDTARDGFLFLGGFLNVGVIATIVIVVLLVLWGRRRGDRKGESYLSDDHTRKVEAAPPKDESRDGGKAR